MLISQREIQSLRKPLPYLSRDGFVEVTDLIVEYSQGVSINKLSFEYKLSELRVRQLLTDNGIQIRNQSQAFRAQEINR